MALSSSGRGGCTSACRKRESMSVSRGCNGGYLCVGAWHWPRASEGAPPECVTVYSQGHRGTCLLAQQGGGGVHADSARSAKGHIPWAPAFMAVGQATVTGWGGVLLPDSPFPPPYLGRLQLPYFLSHQKNIKISPKSATTN